MTYYLSPAIITLAVIGIFPSISNAQQSNAPFEKASDFCISYVLNKDLPLSKLQKVGFQITKKKNGHLFGKAETKADIVKIFTQGRRKRKNCLIETSPKKYRGTSQGPAIGSLLSWLKSSNYKLLNLQKGLMQIVVGRQTISILLIGRTHRGRKTTSFTFSKQR